MSGAVGDAAKAAGIVGAEARTQMLEEDFVERRERGVRIVLEERSVQREAAE